jgi:RNA polymerase sigma-70 factor, ECF subfamily
VPPEARHVADRVSAIRGVPPVEPNLADRRTVMDLVPGSRADFERLYRATYPRVFATCLAVLGGDPAAAEDCAQDAYVRAFRAWGRWRREAPPDLWMHRIAVNVARTYRRRRYLRDLPLLVDLPSTAEGGLDDAVALWQALGQIPVVEAAAFVLRFHQGYSGEEVAAVLGVSVRTAFGRIAKARSRLQGLLDPRPSDSGDGTAHRAELRGSRARRV